MSFTVVPGIGPAFIGRIDTTVDALRIVSAAIDGIIPRTSRRLTGSERTQMVRSGAVFVFSVIESGIKRWTDGKLWSPSRIRGNFLVYKELDKMDAATSSPTSDNGGSPYDGASAKQDMGRGSMHSTDDLRLAFKTGGLMKKTITISMKDLDFHLVSYYQADDVDAGRLCTPKDRSDLMALYLAPRDFRLDKLRSPPRIKEGSDGRAIIVEDMLEEPGSSRAKATEPGCRRHSSPATPGPTIPRIVPMQREIDMPASDLTQGRRDTYSSLRDAFSGASMSLPPLNSPASNRYYLRSIADHRNLPNERLDPHGTALSPSSNNDHSLYWTASSNQDTIPFLSSSPNQVEQRHPHMQLPPLRQDFDRQERWSDDALMGPGRATSSESAVRGELGASAMGPHSDFSDGSRTAGWYARSELTSRTWYPYNPSTTNMSEGSTANHSDFDNNVHGRSSPSIRARERTPTSTYHDGPRDLRGAESLPDPTESSCQLGHSSYTNTSFTRYDTCADGPRRRSSDSRHDYAPSYSDHR